jgi:catechol 2,3-dioxygenase-like lactoylglutathione lyase family enzyme
MGMQTAKNAIDIGIIVADINASLAFYQDLLGLEKVQEMPVWFGTMHRMAFGDSFVKLIDPKDVPPAGTPGLHSVLGFRYLTFQVSNIDAVCADCETAGVEFEIEKKVLMPGVTIAMVRDPDGNIIEFVQRD